MLKYARSCVRKLSTEFIRALESKPNSCCNWIQAPTVQGLDLFHRVIGEVDGLRVVTRRNKEMVQYEKAEIDLGFRYGLRQCFRGRRGVNLHRLILSR